MEGERPMTRTLSILGAVLLVSGGIANASNWPPHTQSAIKSQTPVAKASATYTKKTFGSIQKCLDGIQSGKLAGDPATVCLGTPPTDPTTSTKLTKAAEKVTLTIPKKCTDADAAALQKAALSYTSCGSTAAGLATCLVADGTRRVRDAIDDAYGTVVANPDKGAQKCQKTLGKESGKLLSGRLKAMQKCLNARAAACGTADPIINCLMPA